MNLLDGTCYLHDFMTPKERLEPLDRVIEGMRREEEILQAYAARLIKAGWTVEPPRG